MRLTNYLVALSDEDWRFVCATMRKMYTSAPCALPPRDAWIALRESVHRRRRAMRLDTASEKARARRAYMASYMRRRRGNK